MKKISIILMLLGYIVLASTYWHSGRTYDVVLGKDGYKPSVINIKNGDVIKFTTTLNAPFWPASDPHPSHILYPEFDPQKGIKNTDSWTIKLKRVGSWEYHDHLNPNFRGTINIVETNPILKIGEAWSNLYKFKVQKHDQKFLDNIAASCIKTQGNRGEFLNCWYTFFSEITKDFGVNEAIGILKSLSDRQMITFSDCHLYADQIGTDAYWQYVSGRKFTINQDFSICSDGFYHGFMSEHVSHGKDIKASQELCNSISGLDKDSLRNCYIGMGNGLTFYYWEIFDLDQKKIINAAIGECKKLTVSIDDCVFGAYSGIDHLYDGLHGSDIKVNLSDPFFLCRLQTIVKYQTYCYERVIPSLSLGLDFDPSKINHWFNKIPSSEARTEAVRRYAINLSEREAYKHSDYKEDLSALPSLLSKCKSLSVGFVKDCEWGIFYNLFYQGVNVWKIRCDEDYLNINEKSICFQAKHDADPAEIQ